MKPLMYDLYCGGGGSTRGFQRAGFRVIGVDNRPQPRYCGDGFILMDVFEFMQRYLDGEYERAMAFAASPPCQKYTTLTKLWKRDYPDLIAETRRLLQTTNLPYAIENVPGAPLVNPIMLCGTMFGLNVIRHRLFECNPLMAMSPAVCTHVLSVVKHGRPPQEGKYVAVTGHFSGIVEARKAMDIDWMTGKELSQAVPPAYTEYIGKWLMKVLDEI